jgi:hypothetical protein
VFIFVMMQVMVTPETFHPLEWRIPRVDSVVHGSIHQVTEDKPGKEHKCIAPHEQVHQCKYGGRQYHTWNRRHKEPLFITRVMVMVSMKCVRKFLQALFFTDQVENKPMGKIFEECPEKHPGQEGQQHARQGVLKRCVPIIQHIDNNRQVHSPDYQRMSLCQHFQVVAFEEAGLAFIMDFLELHAANL